MNNHIVLIVLVLFSIAINLPMIRKPLSEDDGNWYYPAIFWRKGCRLYRNFFWVHGYFGIHWVVAKIFNIFRIENLTFFYWFKLIWYSLTALSIYWMTYCFWHNCIISLTAGIIFAIITGIKKNK